MTVAVAILMKDPADAKTRLSPALGSDAREMLALVLFENTLGFFQRFHLGKPLAVISPSPRIAEIARAHGAEAVADQSKGDINAAAERAAKWAVDIGTNSLLVIHADVPALVAAEISDLIEAGNGYAVAIAESTDGGTNALMLSPPNAIPFRFGHHSASAHEAMASELGLSVARLKLSNLSRDIDTPDDLRSGLMSDEHRNDMLKVIALLGLPEVSAGDDIARLIADAVADAGLRLNAHDIVVVAQKIVSKSEGRMVPFASYKPSS